MKVLNLYAGIGGNRKLWQDTDREHIEVTAVEREQSIADAYQQLFPNDHVVVGDAHQYLLDHFTDFDFIWSSPPCPTHSRLSMGLAGLGIHRYPDMTLYQEILSLQHFFRGQWVVDNVIPYYRALIHPRMVLDRHLFWSNFAIPYQRIVRAYAGGVVGATAPALSQGFGIELPAGISNAKQLLRNAVDPRIGLHIFAAARKGPQQRSFV